MDDDVPRTNRGEGVVIVYLSIIGDSKDLLDEAELVLESIDEHDVVDVIVDELSIIVLIEFEKRIILRVI